MTNRLAIQLNALALLIITLVLCGAYYFQFIWYDLPCPLCLLQRLAMAMMMVGLILNIRQRIRSSHYGIILLSAVFGAAVAVRQILLHIVPGTGNYGKAFFHLHDYTWALIVFVTSMLALGLMLMSEQQYQLDGSERPQRKNKTISIIIWLAIIVVMANVITSLLECGFGACPDNPVNYLFIFH